MHPWLHSSRARIRAAGSRSAAFASSRLGRRLLIAAGVLAALYAVLGFFLLPAYLLPKLEQAYSEVLHREVKVESLYINPFAFSTAMRGIRIADKRTPDIDSAELLLSAEQGYANISLLPLLRGVPVLESVRLIRPHLKLRREADRRYNVQDLIDEWRNQPKSDPRLFTINDLEIVDGNIDFDDRYTNEKHAVTEINLGLPFLSTLPSYADEKILPSLSMKVDGAPLRVSGESTPFGDKHETVLSLRLDKVQLGQYADYLPLRLHFNIASGELDADLQLKFSIAAGKLQALNLSGTALLQKIELQQLSGDTIIAAPSARVALESYDLLGNELRISHLSIEQPTMQLVRYKDGRFNFVAFSAAPVKTAARPSPSAENAAPAAAPKPFRFSIAQSSVNNGTLRYKDIYNAQSYNAALKNVRVSLKNFGNYAEQQGSWQFAFDSDAGERGDGQGRLALSPLAGAGTLKLQSVQLKRFLPLYSDAFKLELRDGILDGQSQFEFGRGQAFKFHAMDLDLRNGVLGLGGERDALFVFPQLALRGAEIDFGQRSLAVGELSATKGSGRIVRMKDGRMQLASLSRREVYGDPARPWKSSIKRIAIQGFTLTYEDQQPAKPVKVSATFIDLNADNFASDSASQISLKAMLNKTGPLSISGPLRVHPLSATLDIEARGIDMLQFEPYWNELVNFNLNHGTIGATGRIILSQSAQGQSGASFNGNVRVADVQTTDRDSGQELLSWRSLFLRNFNFESAPFKASIERVTLSDFYSHLVVRSDGTLNVQSLRTPPHATQETKAAPVPEAPKRVFQIGGIELRGGRVSFADYFVKPNYSAELNKVGGTVSGLNPDKPGQVDIRGTVNANAPFSVEGSINPLAKELYLDLRASARDIDLPALSPYTLKYAGYGIERGKLSFKAHYVLENRQLTADNQLTLDQLTFGERSSGAAGPDLPVHLAVALLKDRNGVIDVDLPISGSLDDPQFSLGGLIGRMFLNLIFKAVTSPFALIGSMFGGGSEELAYVEFEPGGSQLDDTDKRKLDKIAEALRERPGLKLDIIGRADAAADGEGVQRAALLQQMKAQKAAETGATDLQQVRIAPEEYNKYLTLAYKASSISKPRNLIGIAKDLPPAEMEKLLLGGAVMNEEKLRMLANQRSQAAKDWLMTRNAPSERIFLVSPRIDADDIQEGSRSRADFKLH